MQKANHQAVSNDAAGQNITHAFTDQLQTYVCIQWHEGVGSHSLCATAEWCTWRANLQYDVGDIPVQAKFTNLNELMNL